MFSKGFFILTAMILVEEGRSLKVAIIGEGIAGASCASKLRDIFGANVSISAFDANPTGGRAQTIELGDGHFHEAGASIIHQRNRHVKKFVQRTNLTSCSSDGKATLAVFNGEKPVFVGSDNSLWNMAKLFWRYGIDLVRIQRYVGAMLDEFDTVYRLQDNNQSFTDLESLLNAWSSKFPSLLEVSLAQHLSKDGFSDRFIDELVNAATRCNYNQRADKIHAFVGSVALAGFLPGLYSIKGGNFQIASRLFKAAGVAMERSFVTSVQKANNSSSPSYVLHLQDGRSLSGFDFVVLTAPHHPNSSAAWPKFLNMMQPPMPPRPYQPVGATFVRGHLNSNYFHLPRSKTPYAVLMTGSANTDPVSAVGASYPVTGCSAAAEHSAWKVFSADHQPLAEPVLAELFEERQEVRAKQWSGAYPRYEVPQSVKEHKFLLAPGLIATAPIEALASALEMGAISGVNAALLIRNAGFGPQGDTRGGSPIREEL